MPIFNEGWTAAEEFLLLEGVQRYGIGNWEAIGKYVNTKSLYECEYHYWTMYVDCDWYPNIPPLERGIEPPLKISKKDCARDDRGKLLSILAARGEAPYKIPIPKQKPKVLMHDLIGWNNLRKDFYQGYNYKHDAEHLVAHLELKDDDSADTQKYNVGILKYFNNILRERAKRKKFLLDRDLLSQDNLESNFKDISKKKKRNGSIAQINTKAPHVKYRPFCRFIPQPSFDALSKALAKESALRNELNKYKSYRENGIKTQNDIRVYERALANKNHRRKQSSIYSSRKRNSNYDESQDGYDLLSPQEKDLCKDMNIPANKYAVIKDALLRESFRLGYLTIDSAYSIFRKVPTQQLDHIYHYLVSAGFISSQARSNGKSLLPSSTPMTPSTAMPGGTPTKLIFK
eukprot:CAMPEP_0117431862 /NCGR_PEP_ID=MMETSP0758-20121206/11406_1 /TAXON_ID=63605 /ORGANISM="Percolomonas cosmopolitus, Strain AE-1 (ATCC 50343)" /LENGTH=401 /DNA_ID=CAMNT_0005221315 /DNA_START=220 /DNA_END=1425 /DNA_ORIENTATION=+